MARKRPSRHDDFTHPSPTGRDESRAMYTLPSSWLHPVITASSALPHAAALQWQRLLIALRPPVWPAAVAGLLAVGLLLAFQHVVASAVELAERQRASAAAQNESIWRCKMLQPPGARANCLAQLADAHESVAPDGQPTVAATGAAKTEPMGRYTVVGLPSLAQPLEK
jgi:hypothetical protein